MKYAILGGSFNPVHIGHLLLADAALSFFDYDRVILVPAFKSPFKDIPKGATPADRLDMLAASIADNPRLTIDGCELDREGDSYTIDTLKHIISVYKPDGKPGLILGDDLVSTFLKWRNPDEIVSLADIIIAQRLLKPNAAETGATETAKTEIRKNEENFPYPYRALENDIVKAASQEIREKIASGKAWRYLVPQGARQIIEDRGLYGYGQSEPGHETTVNVENTVRAKLDFDRFMHSRNTALLAWDLCRRFGLDSQKGYLAGIAHDMCKYMDVKTLMRTAREDGRGFSKLEYEKPGLLHARAAAVMLQKSFGVSDRDILEAVRYHTTGIHDMDAIAKVVYIADKIEISRMGVDPALRELSRYGDLDSLFLAVLNNTVSYLKSRQLDISYGTKRLLAAMGKRSKS